MRKLFFNSLLLLLLFGTSTLFSQIHVKAIVHIVNKSIKSSKVNTEMHNLNTYFANTGITIMLHDIKSIKKNAYEKVLVTGFSCQHASAQIFDNNDPKALNIYVVPETSLGHAFAEKVGGFACVIEEGHFGGSTIAHEVGHCFGLYHTAEQCMGKENMHNKAGCLNNSATAGDKIEDTEPYCYRNDPIDNCGNAYPSSANPKNIMNQGGGERYKFTPGQIKRMKETVSSLLFNTIYNPIKKVHVKNSFGEGLMIINNAPYAEIIPTDGKLIENWNASSFPNFLEAVDKQQPQGQKYTQRFNYWVTPDNTKKYAKDIMVENPKSFLTDYYTANFINEYNITFKNSFVGVGNGGIIKVNNIIKNSPTGIYQIRADHYKGISFEAINQTINGIYYKFSHWQDWNTNSRRTVKPAKNENYIAYFTGKPVHSNRILLFSSGRRSRFGAPVVLSWNDHINPKVTKYTIWRKRGKNSPVNYIATVNRGVETFVDNLVTFSGSFDPSKLTRYDVRAYYSTENSYADTNLKYAGITNILLKQNDGENENEDIEIIDEYALNSNYPNPFNPTTQISYQIPKSGFVNLVVYNALGQEVAELVNQNQSMGKYSVQFDANNLPSGVYIYSLQAGEFSSVKKMLLTK